MSINPPGMLSYDMLTMPIVFYNNERNVMTVKPNISTPSPEKAYVPTNESVFAIGDVVRLKSAPTPKMTVHKIDISNFVVTCRWFDEHDDLLTENFYFDELILVRRE